jgi:tetratricopeptide (TPR) repeat protein
MANLLKAMGFWIWGLLAIGLSISVLTVSHRLNIFARLPNAQSEARPIETTRQPPSPTTAPVDEPIINPALSHVIHADMRAAQKAMQSQQWSDALKALDAAQARGDPGTVLTAFDNAQIQDFRAFVFAKLNQHRAAQDAYEKALATGGLSAAETVAVIKTLMALAAGNRDYTKVTDYAQLRDAQGKLTSAEYLMVAQSYFQLRDYAKAILWADRAITDARASGAKPPENLLYVKLEAAADSGNNRVMADVLFDLIRMTNKPAYWNTLLRLERSDERPGHNLLLIERLMYDTNAIPQDSDYIELAGLLGDAGLPSEAAMVLKTAQASRSLKPERRERLDHLFEVMTKRADADSERLTPDEARSLVLSNASEDAAHSFGAPTAIEETATRHQLAQADELNLYVARVMVIQGDYAGAKKAIEKFSVGCTPKIAALWMLYADTLPEPAPPNPT